MSDKKFPTPNLERFIGEMVNVYLSCSLGESVDLDKDSPVVKELRKSVQADIALAVEAAKNVPDADVVQHLIECVSGYGWTDHEREKAKKWLKSLTVAPKSEPAAEDKRCGTCASFESRLDLAQSYGQCNCSVIQSTTRSSGDMCLCWKKAGT